ncbi:hypothetical protein BDW74DRAFT_172630 [Aspergillus multicolor]|uniref:uncharacterized protein n=1 Tax=Aspergillus multicolor TaxID=41759 RepID=UPI003CCD4A15
MDQRNSSDKLAVPDPMLTLQLYRRCFKGRKQLFSKSDIAAANYFVTNPVPHKHSDTWKPVFYRGDNPKYTPTTRAIGRARRSKIDEKKVVQGKVVMIRMQRMGILSRSVEWELEGVRYRWSGTRMFATGYMTKAKGWSHSMKLVRVSDHTLIATFEKGVLGSRKSVKTGESPNKAKTLLGKLRVYDISEKSPMYPAELQKDHLTSLTARVDAGSTKPSNIKDERDLNPNGFHSGNLTGDAIAFTCWIVVEAEHRLRCKILDFLEKVAENVQGD